MSFKVAIVSVRRQSTRCSVIMSCKINSRRLLVMLSSFFLCNSSCKRSRCVDIVFPDETSLIRVLRTLRARHLDPCSTNPPWPPLEPSPPPIPPKNLQHCKFLRPTVNWKLFKPCSPPPPPRQISSMHWTTMGCLRWLRRHPTVKQQSLHFCCPWGPGATSRTRMETLLCTPAPMLNARCCCSVVKIAIQIN